MKHFVNDPGDAVVEALDGILRAAGVDGLARLDGYPDIKVVTAADHPRDRVAVISGGGAGHEPAHAGFVGDGLLAAAVCGDIFASPSVEAVLAGIRSVTGSAGCLLIVKNYTGDRLNFGLAAERARGLGLDVRMVVVGDDIALPDAAQPRGLAGTLLVHKTAGAWAQRGASLDEVHAAAADVAGAVRTLAVSLSGTDIPGRPSEARLGDDEVELGLGIHGEPGAETIPTEPCRALVARMVDRLVAALPPEVPLAVVVNNLGGTSALEMGIVVGELLTGELGPRVELLLGPAPLMTSLGMRGISVSALPLNPARRQALLDPVAPWTAWPGVRRVGPATIRRLPPTPRSARPAASDDPAVRRMVTTVCGALIGERLALDALDAKVGDGDTGTTMAAAAQRVLDDLDQLPLADRSALLVRLSDLLAEVMGGSSGVLLSILLAAAGGALGGGASPGAALVEGAEAMARYGGAAEGDRTMLDALLPAGRVLRDGGSLSEAAVAAREGAARTAAMTRARAGRSSYVGEAHLAGVVDPGAHAVSTVLDALASET